jgi:hypothetical protein
MGLIRLYIFLENLSKDLEGYRKPTSNFATATAKPLKEPVTPNTFASLEMRLNISLSHCAIHVAIFFFLIIAFGIIGYLAT